jgi:hypothetical protein
MSKRVRVPDVFNMDAETFLKHLEARHATDTDVENFVRVNVNERWLSNYRVFHDRCHAIAVPKQYDHKHKDYEEEKEE